MWKRVGCGLAAEGWQGCALQEEEMVVCAVAI